MRKGDWELNSTQQFLNRVGLKSSLSHTPSTPTPPTHDVSRATPFSSQIDNGGLYIYGGSKNICKYPAFTDGFSPFEIRTKIRQERVNVSFGCLRMSWWRKKFADFIVIFMACWPCEWIDIVLVCAPFSVNLIMSFEFFVMREKANFWRETVLRRGIGHPPVCATLSYYRAVFKSLTKVNHAITMDTLRDWFAPIFQPLWSKTKTNRTLNAQFFPRFGQVTSNC